MSKLHLVKKAAILGIITVSNPKRARRGAKKIVARKRLYREREQDYMRWFEQNRLSKGELTKQRAEAKKFKQRPLVSILVPLYNTPEHFLRQCLDSVLGQTYENWELCVADDASPNEHVKKVMGEYTSQDKRIKFVSLAKNQHIVGASNEALKLAKGEFIALLDHDDLLLPEALYEMVKKINDNPDADLVYSDEDKIDEKGRHIEPFFKPDWSPDFLLSCNYITHLAVLRRAVVESIGGFRWGTEGAQDWDLFLRFTKKTTNVQHVPKVLYSWRKSETSTAKAAKSKPYAYTSQKRVLRDDLSDNTRASSVFESIYLGFWRVRYAISGHPLVSIVIPTKDNYEYIARCVNSIVELTNYANFEVIIVDTGTTDKETLDFYDSKVVKSNKIDVVNWYKTPFNFSSACNFGAKHAGGNYLLFLNDDTEVISSDWIESMLEHAQREEIGMVGCKLLFSNKNIQHAGVLLREGDIAVHPFYNTHEKQDIFANIYISNIRNCLAVTAACSLVAKDKFNRVGGFNEELLVTYNDVDLCLKLFDAGYLNLYTPYAELFHHESISVGKIATELRDNQELQAASDYMRKKWGKYLERDPFYNDNFAPKGHPYRLFEK